MPARDGPVRRERRTRRRRALRGIFGRAKERAGGLEEARQNLPKLALVACFQAETARGDTYSYYFTDLAMETDETNTSRQGRHVLLLLHRL